MRETNWKSHKSTLTLIDGITMIRCTFFLLTFFVTFVRPKSDYSDEDILETFLDLIDPMQPNEKIPVSIFLYFAFTVSRWCRLRQFILHLSSWKLHLSISVFYTRVHSDSIFILLRIDFGVNFRSHFWPTACPFY